MNKIICWRLPILLSVLILAAPCYANGLAVSPLKLSLKPNQQMTSLTVTNTGSKTLLVQGKVMTWVNSADLSGSEKASAMTLTPPIFKLAPKAKQLVRVGWQSQTLPPPSEQAYRVVLQEVPAPLAMAEGLKVTLAISLPLFAEPNNPAINRIDWEYQGDEQPQQIFLKNRGNRHHRYTHVRITDAQQQPIFEAPQLLYVLPGQHHGFSLPSMPLAFPLQIETTSDLGKQIQVLSAPPT